MNLKPTFNILAITASLTLSAGPVLADGFKCEGVNTGVKVKVYNFTDPSAGTRNPRIMVVSDSYVNAPNKTIATFKGALNDGVDGLLEYKGYGLYEAKVDLRYQGSSRKGENIAGTKLGQLKTIQLQIFKTEPNQLPEPRTSNDVMKNGEAADARITYLKRNGEVLEEKAICVRYLKN